MNDIVQKTCDMIEALEEKKDDALLTKLIQADESLLVYGRLLSRACCYLEDPVIVEKLLNMPVLDKSSIDYKNTAEQTFSYIAANTKSPNMQIARLLFDCFKDDAERNNNSLRFIFETVVIDGTTRPSKELAKLLIEHGADPEAAAEPQQAQLEGQKKHTQRLLDKLSTFKATVSTPS